MKKSINFIIFLAAVILNFITPSVYSFSIRYCAPVIRKGFNDYLDIYYDTDPRLQTLIATTPQALESKELLRRLLPTARYIRLYDGHSFSDYSPLSSSEAYTVAVRIPTTSLIVPLTIARNDALVITWECEKAADTCQLVIRENECAETGLGCTCASPCVTDQTHQKEISRSASFDYLAYDKARVQEIEHEIAQEKERIKAEQAAQAERDRRRIEEERLRIERERQAWERAQQVGSAVSGTLSFLGALAQEAQKPGALPFLH
jgi:hypothetical protein